MCSFKLIYFIIFLFNIYRTNCLISDKRLCMNADCSEPVSLAKTLLRYSSPEPSILSFSPNVNIKVFSKEAGSRTDLWGVEINGKRGYVPKNLVRENKIYGKPTVVVDTELSQKPEVPAEKPPDEKVNPDKVQEPFEVIDGTTILLDPNTISPSSTESPVLSTASNVVNNQSPNSTEAKEPEAAERKQETTTEEKPQQVVENIQHAAESVQIENVNANDAENVKPATAEPIHDENVKSTAAEPIQDENVKSTAAEPIQGENVKSTAAEPIQDENVKTAAEPTQDENVKQTITEPVQVENVAEPIQIESNTVEPSQDKKIESDTPESVVGGMFSSIKNWMKDDNLSDDEDDDEDEDVIEELEQENSSEQLKTLNEDTSGEEMEEKAAVIDENISTPKVQLELEKLDEKLVDMLKKPTENEIEYSKQKHETEGHSKEVRETSEVNKLSEAVVTLNENVEVNKEEEKNNLEPQLKMEENKKSEDNQHTVLNAAKETVPDNEKPEDNKIKPEEKTTETVTEEPRPEETRLEEKPIQIQTDENINKIVTESVEATTLPSLDQGEALPILTVDEVTPNPVDPKPQDNIFSPVASLFNKHTDSSINGVAPNSQESVVSDSGENLTSSENYETRFQQPNTFSGQAEINNEYISNSKNDSESIEHPVESDATIGNEWSMDKLVDRKAELQADTPMEQPSNSWHGNANTNIDSSADINNLENTGTVGRNGQQNLEIPSDSQIDSLKNDGIVPNHLLGEDQDGGEVIETVVVNTETGGMFSGIFSLFGGEETEKRKTDSASTPIGSADQLAQQRSNLYKSADIGYCTNPQDNCDKFEETDSLVDKLVFLMNSDILLYLATTAVSCIIFLFLYLLVDKNRREAPLVAKINKLEKELLVTVKEKDLLQEGVSSLNQVPSEEVDLLKQKLVENEIEKQNLEMLVVNLQKEVEDKVGLEDQIESLEKELETSTEVGMELNRIISEMLDPNNGGEKLKENVEQLQRQLSEQKWIINDISKSLSDKEAENAELQVQLDESKKKSGELQKKLDEIVDQILKIEKERDQQQKSLQEEISLYQQKFSDEMMKKEMLKNEIQIFKTQLADAQRKAELKIKEYQSLKDSLDGIKSIKNDKAALQSLLDSTSVRAELEQLKIENESYMLRVQEEETAKMAYEKQYQAVIEENSALLKKYQESDKEKVESVLKLEVLNNYFKKREEELQTEILKYKSIWETKEGEATSTTERVKLMAEEIENYKSQTETLKQEIVSQEIDLKSQISMLEKKVHENWVSSRQMDRKLEDARQEAAQLRNRLTLRERAMIDERTQNRLQSPVDQNGELTLSPPPIESPASPSMLFGGRDHITKSPPLPGLPPFLPPPPGAPFMPPPLHGMPFMPPPPSMFPGDHRPPPLGRMSSPPPLNSRYSPDTSAFSPYDRNTPSPPYDSEYGASPPPIRGYSPYSRDDRRDYKRPIHISNGRNNKGSLMSSGSDNSNDSLNKTNRKHSKMV